MRKTVTLLSAILIVLCLVACTAKKAVGGSVSNVESIPTSSATSSETVSTSEPSSTTPSSSEESSSAPPSSSSEITSSDTPPVTPPPSPPPVIPPITEVIMPLDKGEYYGYKNLTALQKAAYDTLAESVEIMTSGYIDLGPATDITERDAHHIAVTLKNDRPDIFWLPYTWVIGELDDGDMAILFVNEQVGEEESEEIESLTATYVVKRAEKAVMQEELRAAVEEIKARITATDPYEIERELHDILCETVSYSVTPDPLSYTAYGALVRGDAVCEGYTRAMQLLLYEFGIRSTPIIGFTNEPHMWNLVEIEGKWYHLDVTFGDDLLGIRHDYFNLTDPGISQSRTIDPPPDGFTDEELFEGKPYNFMLPVCNSTDAWYFARTGVQYEGDLESLVTLIVESEENEIELVGYNAEMREPLLQKLNLAGFTAASVWSEGGWAKIFKTATADITEETTGDNVL